MKKTTETSNIELMSSISNLKHPFNPIKSWEKIVSKFICELQV